jgi:leader peptidase (prepilin peptidase) / N-methyltransferase
LSPFLDIIVDGVVLAYGLCIGSFLNVCIYRIPKRKSIVFPASHCPRCKARIPWYYNIPVLSYIALRGKCASCKGKISLCYPIVELVTGLMAVAVARHFRGAEHFVLLSVSYFAFICGLIIITGIDLRYFIIPDVISLSGIILGVAFSFFLPEMQGEASHLRGLIYSLGSSLISAGILLAIALGGTLIFRKEAMGMGDVKLVAMFGAFLGFKLTLLAIFLSSVVGSIAGVSLIAAGRAKMQSRIPFGPYLAGGAVIALFYGERLIQLYIRLITGGVSN